MHGELSKSNEVKEKNSYYLLNHLEMNYNKSNWHTFTLCVIRRMMSTYICAVTELSWTEPSWTEPSLVDDMLYSMLISLCFDDLFCMNDVLMVCLVNRLR